MKGEKDIANNTITHKTQPQDVPAITQNIQPKVLRLMHLTQNMVNDLKNTLTCFLDCFYKSPYLYALTQESTTNCTSSFRRHFWLLDHSFLHKGRHSLLEQEKQLAELLVLHPNNKIVTFIYSCFVQNTVPDKNS